MKPKNIDSPPLSAEEIRDIEDFYAHPEENTVSTLDEPLAELHGPDPDSASDPKAD